MIGWFGYRIHTSPAARDPTFVISCLLISFNFIFPKTTLQPNVTCNMNTESNLFTLCFALM